jgi:hypothetical protein
MHVFKREHSQGAKGVPSRKLWHALHAIDKYLRGQAAWLVHRFYETDQLWGILQTAPHVVG